MLKFTVDAHAPKLPLPHYWETCVGSCHAYTALREDWRNQLKKVHQQMGFRYVRFHGLFNDDMSVVTASHDGSLRYCFANVDSIFDFLLSIGMKPFVEMGFMPTALASTKATCFHYQGNISLPRNYALWDEFIQAFIRHLADRYGLAEVRSWFFEVWNEPNLTYFFEGTQQDYFKLYDHTVRTIKAVDSMLPVGGPATAINGWIPELIEYCKKNQVPLDFISTHHYPTDDPLWRNSNIPLEELFKELNADSQNHYERGILKKMTEKARREAGSLPLYYTEWNSSAILPDPIHDGPYTAALAAKAVVDNLGIADGYSYWTFTDIFEEQGQIPGEFHGGFGMQTFHGIPKPVYHAFCFLHQLGSEQLPVTGEQETVGMLASVKDGGMAFLVYNHQVADGDIQSQQVCLAVDHCEFASAQITLVDQDHGNPRKLWEELGSPVYPNAVELAELYQASKLEPQKLELNRDAGQGKVCFELPPHSVGLIILK